MKWFVVGVALNAAILPVIGGQEKNQTWSNWQLVEAGGSGSPDYDLDAAGVQSDGSTAPAPGHHHHVSGILDWTVTVQLTFLLYVAIVGLMVYTAANDVASPPLSWWRWPIVIVVIFLWPIFLAIWPIEKLRAKIKRRKMKC